MKFYFFILLSIISAGLSAQFAPPALQLGTTAIHKDSAIFIYWASGAKVNAGYQNIANTSLGKANVGDSSMALGKAGENGIVSLGDGGEAILTFEYAIRNGNGFDFAVFENSFSDDFLELAFVEVSSDGVNFFRFPATSNTDTTTQTGSFGATDATKINNLAGKYRALYGTPFDLEELKNEIGLDVNNITHVKIVDVVGSMQNQYASRDQYGHKINDPWPTAFGSSGFDLDGVGVINSLGNDISELATTVFRVYPNPIDNGAVLNFQNAKGNITIVDVQGAIVYASPVNENNYTLVLSFLNSGIFFVYLNDGNNIHTQKIVVR